MDSPKQKTNYLQLYLYAHSHAHFMHSEIILREMEKEYNLKPMDEKGWQEWMKSRQVEDEVESSVQQYAKAMNQ